ncbi:orotate phosphoribosyltransferase [bacterium]|nr:orotate phosphoribosyltransferase [candidate division CSSED10-310 bacterium]
MNGHQIEQAFLELLSATEALQTGHFMLSSGLHSGKYIQCARLLQYPAYAAQVGEWLAGAVSGHHIDKVIAPAIGGLILGHEVARALSVPFIFTERRDGRHQLRRGFTIAPQEQLVIIEDVTTTGGSIREVDTIVRAANATPVAAGTAVLRGPVPDLHEPFFYLARLQFETFIPDQCPLCAAGMPVQKPGSNVGPDHGPRP